MAGGPFAGESWESMHSFRVAQMTSTAGIAPARRHRMTTPHAVAVLAFDGVVLADLAGPSEILRRARGGNGRNLYSVTICSDTAVVATEGLELLVPRRLTYLAAAGTILIPGIDDLDRPIPSRVTRAISRAIERGKRVVSVCSGAFVLAATGKLAGLRATTHWMTCAELA